MAKRKTAARKVTPKRGHKGNGKVNARRTRSRAPKDTPLPGMEDMHHPQLGPMASAVAEIRLAAAEGREEEEKILPKALKVMHAEQRTVFQAHGIRFVRVEGEEKLLVKSAGRRGKQATATVEAPAS
jgi:hypothetical protein